MLLPIGWYMLQETKTNAGMQLNLSPQWVEGTAAGISTQNNGEASGQQSQEEAELAASIPELSPLDKKFMEKLNRLIEENMTTVDIDIAFMTDKMAMSHSSFYRKVKALTGLSANEYIRKIKLQRSMVLLQEGESNVTMRKLSRKIQIKTQLLIP